MELLLTIVEAPGQTDIAEPSKTFSSETGGSIGRGADNTWVLADPERIVSSRHATLAFANGAFAITDHSTNGTFVNDNLSPLGSGNSTPLRDGDMLTVGGYRLRAQLLQSRQAQAPAQAPAAAPAAAAGGLPEGLEAVDFLDPAPAPAAPAAPGAAAQPLPAEDDFDKWLEPKAEAEAKPWSATALGGDPLPGLQAEETDPLAALDKSAGLPHQQAAQEDSWALAGAAGDGSESDDADWWKTSFSDHAPADSHAMPPVSPQPDPNLAPPAGPQPDPNLAPPANPQPGPGLAPADSWAAAASADITSPQPVVTPQPAASQPAAAQQPSHPPQAAAAAVPVTPTVAQAAAVTTQPGAAETTAPQPPAAANTAPPADSAGLAQELGLKDLTPERQQTLVRESATILRESVRNLMSLLSARASIKNELRVDRTMIMPTENNPLKFSPNAEAALIAMFGNASDAFIAPGDAVKEGFEDISDHQVAVLVGMKAAFDAMLAQFDPARLERRFGAQEGRSLLGGKNARLWEKYVAHFEQLKTDREGSYRQLFGDAFAEAYELQLAKLKGLRKKG